MLARVTPLAVALALAVLLISAAPSATTQLAPSIYSIRPDGTGRALVVHLAPPVYLLRRSQDGQEIAFSRDLPPKQSLYVTDVSGKKDPVQIHPAGYPTFSPDGTRLAVENRMGLYVVNVDDTGLRRVAEAGGLASWSPDGRSLAYLGGGNTSWRSTIHVVSAEGGGDVEIATGITPSGHRGATGSRT